MVKEMTAEAKAIRADLEERLRSPFRDVLAVWMEAFPDSESLKAFAKKCPDRWSQGAAILGWLSGYGDKVELEGDLSFNRKLDEKSDGELMANHARFPREAVRSNPKLFREALAEAEQKENSGN